MNRQPISYFQTDKRWKDMPYRVPGESATIGDSGCGPTCAAMLIETLTGQTFTPVQACKWSLERGYKALKQGTFYSYFKPQFATFGIDCNQLNWTNVYGQPDSPTHKKAFDMLKQGYYIIACMGKGLWTSSGHFIVLWWEDGKVRINDPASTKTERLNGDLWTFCSQVKYYWWVDARRHNGGDGKDDDEMTQEQFNKMMAEYEASKNAKPDNTPADWEKAGVAWATDNGLMVGDGNGDLQLHSTITRAQFCVMLKRYHEKKNSIA